MKVVIYRTSKAIESDEINLLRELHVNYHINDDKIVSVMSRQNFIDFLEKLGVECIVLFDVDQEAFNVEIYDDWRE